MSEHGEVVSPLQESEGGPNRLNMDTGSDSSHHGVPPSSKFQNSETDSHIPFSENSNPLHNSSNAYNAVPTFSAREDATEHFGTEQPSFQNDTELDPSASFPGLNQLTGLVPTVSQLTSMVPTNATDALVTVMPWMQEAKELLPHQEAAILLEFARDGQDLNGSSLTLRSRLCYRLRRKYHWIFRIAAWSLLIIHIFQRPYWTRLQDKAQTWNDTHHFPTWGLTYLDATTANVLVFLCLIVNWMGVGLELGYKRNTSNVYIPYTSMVILFIKSVFNIANFALIGSGQSPVSCSPIEGFLCILIELQHNNNVSFLLRSIPKFAVLMVCMAVFVMIYTALGMMIFDPNAGEGQNVFSDYGIGLWNMMMVLNGANWPGPMVPALVTNRFFVTYFYVFLIVVVWGLLNIVLGFNYLFFQSEQKTISDMQEKTRLDNKATAFRILDTENKGYLTYEQVDVLLVEMYAFYEELSDVPSAEERHELILALDTYDDSTITEEDFATLEVKCFQGALKKLRSKKRKFSRYISANIIKEQSTSLLKEQTEKLKLATTQASARVGIKLGEEGHSAASTHPSQHGDTLGSYSSVADESSKVHNPLVLSDSAAAEAAESGEQTEGSPGFSSSSTSQQLTVTAPNELSVETKQSRAALIEAAARYAGMYRDPKLMDWYHSMGNKQIEALSKSRGRTFGQVLSHFAMQVDSIYFDIFSDTLIVGLGIALLVHKPQPGFVITYNVFTLLEMVVKFFVKGYHRYVTSNRSSIDGRIALSLLALNIINAAVPAPNHTQVIIKTLVMIRTLLYPRNLIVTNGFKNFRNRQRVALSFAFQSVDHFAFLLLVLVVMMYVFAGVGLQIFGGAIDRESSRVADSDYAALGYWPLNFNDMPSGIVTMFTLLSVNDMNVTTSGFTAALSQWAEVFFALWYCFGVLFILNVLTAIFLNQFIGYLEHLSTERLAAEEAELLKLEDKMQDNARLALQEGGSSESQDPDDQDSRSRGGSDCSTSTPGLKSSSHHHSRDNTDEVVIPFRRPSITDQAGPSKPAWLDPAQSDGSFVPEPEYYDDSTNLHSDEGKSKRKSLFGGAGKLFSGATHKTSDVLHGTSAMLTGTTAKASGLVNASTTGLNSFVKLFVIDESEENVDGTAGTGSSPTTGDHRSSSFGTSPQRSSARQTRPARSPANVRTKRGSQFTALPTMGEDEEMTNLNSNIGSGIVSGSHYGSHTSATRTVAPSSKQSIFATDSDRQEINDWVNSRRRKRRNSRTSEVPSRIRADTGLTDDGNWAPAAKPQSSDWDEAEAAIQNQATSPLHDEPAGVEMTPKNTWSFTSVLTQSDDVGDGAVKSQEYKLMTFYDWFYKEDQITPVEAAAVLVQGAIDGEDPELFTSRRALWCFHKRTQYANLFKICAALYSVLKFFQRPIWTFNEPNWDNSTFFPVSGMPQWSPAVTGGLKIPLLIVMFCGMWLEVGYQDAGFSSMFSNFTVKRTLRYALFLYCLVQFLLVSYSFGEGSVKLVALTSCGSMLYVMWFVRRSFRKMRNVVKVMPQLAKVLLLYALIVVVFSGIGPFLYNIENVGVDDDIAGEYYKDFPTATWSIFIAMTTSSYPNQVMPAYRQYREFSMFFFLFVTIGALFMLNLIIAIVFVEFQKASLISAEFQRTVRLVLLTEAYDTLDVDERDYLKHNQANEVINELYANFPAFRKSGRPDGKVRSAFIASLDANSNGRIYMDDFQRFLDVAKTKAATVPGPTFMELWFPSIVEGKAFQLLKRCVLYEYTNMIFDVTIAVFTISSMAANSGNLYESTDSSVALGAVQMVIMVLEATVKIVVRGWSRYRASFRNQLDFVITCGAFVAVLGASAYDGVSGFTLARRSLLVLRLFWLPRNIRFLLDSKMIKSVTKLCWRIVGKTLTLGVVFMCILYAFASIGMFAFGGQINRDPTSANYNALMNSRYAADGYFPLNFNDFMSSLITIFACLHVSDFDVITEGMSVTSTNAARLYFATWYVVGVLLMLNILKSFFLDEFLGMFSAAASGEDEEEKVKEVENAPENEGQVNPETEIDVVNPIMAVTGLPTIEEEEDQVVHKDAVDQVFNPLADSAAAKPLPLASGPPPHDTDSVQANIFSPEKPKKPKRQSKPPKVAPIDFGPAEAELDLMNTHAAHVPVEEHSLLGLEAHVLPPAPLVPPPLPAVAPPVPQVPVLPPPPLPMAPPPVPPPLPPLVHYSEENEAVPEEYVENFPEDGSVDVLPAVAEEDAEAVEETPISTHADEEEDGGFLLLPEESEAVTAETSAEEEEPAVQQQEEEELVEEISEPVVEESPAEEENAVIDEVETQPVVEAEVVEDVVEPAQEENVEEDLIAAAPSVPSVPPPLPPVPPPLPPVPVPSYDAPAVEQEESLLDLAEAVELPTTPPPPPPVPAPLVAAPLVPAVPPPVPPMPLSVESTTEHVESPTAAESAATEDKVEALLDMLGIEPVNYSPADAEVEEQLLTLVNAGEESGSLSPDIPTPAAPEVETDLLGLDSDYVHTEVPSQAATDDLLDFLSEGAPAPYAAPAVADLLSDDLLSDAPLQQEAAVIAPVAETDEVADLDDADEAEAEEASANVSVRDRSSSGIGKKNKKKKSKGKK